MFWLFRGLALFFNKNEREAYLTFDHNLTGVSVKKIIGLVTLLVAQSTMAATIDSGIGYQGVITRLDGSALVNPSVVFRVSVLSPGAEGCYLYDEYQTLNMSSDQGNFSLTVGRGSKTFTGSKNPSPVLSLSSAFDNSKPLSGLTCASGAAYQPGASDIRILRVAFYDGSVWTSLPDSKIYSSPYSEHAATLSGIAKEGFVQTNTATANVTQTSVESVFKDVNSVSDLIALITGNSSKYVQANGNSAPVVAAAPTAANQVTNKGYADSNIAGKTVDSSISSLTSAQAGQNLVWNGTAWVAQAAPISGINQLTGDVTASGTGSAAATISNGAVTDAKIASGISASKISGTLPLSTIPGLSTSQLTAGTLPVARGGTGASTFSGNQLVGSDITGTILKSISCPMGQVYSKPTCNLKRQRRRSSKSHLRIRHVGQFRC